MAASGDVAAKRAQVVGTVCVEDAQNRAKEETLVKDIRKFLWFTLSAGALATAGLGGALADDPVWDGDQLLPLESGFPSGPLTILVIDRPGSSDSIYATELARAAERYSPVAVRVDHRTDFSVWDTWEALAWMAGERQGQAGESLVVVPMPGILMDLLVADLRTEIGVDETDLVPIVVSERLPWFLHQNSNVSWGDTLEDFLAHAEANPDTIRYISGGPGAGQDAAMKWYQSHLGFTVNEIIGGGSSERALAVASGEGEVTVSPPDAILPHYENGRLQILLMSGEGPAPEPWTAVPTAESLGLEGDPWGTNRGVAVTGLVPQDNQRWLEELFLRAANDPDLQASRGNIPGILLDPMGREEAAEFKAQAIEQARPIFQDLGMYWRDQQ